MKLFDQILYHRSISNVAKYSLNIFGKQHAQKVLSIFDIDFFRWNTVKIGKDFLDILHVLQIVQYENIDLMNFWKLLSLEILGNSN